jgi:iron(III) transport system permease protein
VALGRRGDHRLWLFVTVVVPLSGITLRAFVTNWGDGVKLSDVLTLEHFREVFDEPNARARHLNTS